MSGIEKTKIIDKFINENEDNISKVYTLSEKLDDIYLFEDDMIKSFKYGGHLRYVHRIKYSKKEIKEIIDDCGIQIFLKYLLDKNYNGSINEYNLLLNFIFNEKDLFKDWN